MTPVDASNNPDKVKYNVKSTKVGYLKLAIMLEMQINVISFLKVTLLIGIENYLKLMKF